MSGRLTLLLPPLLLFTGMFVLLWGKAKDRKFERKMIYGAKERLEQLSFEQTLKDRILSLRGQAKPSLIKEAFRTKGSFLPPLLGIAGFIASGLFLGSFITAVPVALSCYMFPSWMRSRNCMPLPT